MTLFSVTVMYFQLMFEGLIMSVRMLEKEFYTNMFHLLPDNITATEKGYIINRLRKFNATVYNNKYKKYGEVVRIGTIKTFPFPKSVLHKEPLKWCFVMYNYQIEENFLGDDVKEYNLMMDYLNQKIDMDY